MQRSARRGTVFVVVLIALVAAALISLASLQRTTSQLRSTWIQNYEVQAELIAESAVQLTQVRLQSKPEFSGETWEIDPSDFGLDEPGLVITEVTSTPGTDFQKISVQVRIGSEPPRMVHASRHIELEPRSQEPRQ